MLRTKLSLGDIETLLTQPKHPGHSGIHGMMAEGTSQQ